MAKIEAILFDLDDTLYPEIEYVKSGFRVVAKFISQYGANEDAVFAQMLDDLAQNGRGKIFDRILEKFALKNRLSVQTLVFMYRTHIPEISLPKESESFLDRLFSIGITLGIVTDGATIVQRHKICALGLEKWCKIMLCTDVLGKEFWKPSPVPFMVALNLLNLEPKESIYVGNDPKKDFLGANQIGMQTIWLNPDAREFPFKETQERPSYEVRNLSQILEMLL